MVNLGSNDVHCFIGLFQEEQSNQDDSGTDEIEPRLKYVRLRNDLERILQNDAASCFAVHPKV